MTTKRTNPYRSEKESLDAFSGQVTLKRTRGQPSLGPRTPLTVRLPDDLLATLQARAAAHGRSTNAELVEILRRAMTAPSPQAIADAYLAGLDDTHKDELWCTDRGAARMFIPEFVALLNKQHTGEPDA